MVKFSREYEASIIPEWKAAFVDYKGLKKLVKRIKIARRDAAPLLAASREAGRSDGGGSNASSGTYGFSVLDPVRALAAHFAATPPASPTQVGEDDDGDSDSLESDSGELVRATDKHEQEFLEKADEELEKVNKFYAAQEADMLARGEALIEQLRILADVKRILTDHAAASRRGRSRLARTTPPHSPSVNGSNSGRHLLSSPFVVASPQSMSDGSVELQQARVAEGAAVAEEVMAALERNGVSFVGGGLGKAKKDGSGKQLMGRAALLQMPATVRIDIPPTSPGRAALKVWEELVNVLRKDGADPAAAFVHRKKVQHAEKNIRDAFLALYRGLELLKKFSSLNVKAFTKILKKFVKYNHLRRPMPGLLPLSQPRPSIRPASGNNAGASSTQLRPPLLFLTLPANSSGRAWHMSTLLPKAITATGCPSRDRPLPSWLPVASSSTLLAAIAPLPPRRHDRLSGPA